MTRRKDMPINHQQGTTFNDIYTIVYSSTTSLKQTDHVAKYIKETYIHKINLKLY